MVLLLLKDIWELLINEIGGGGSFKLFSLFLFIWVVSVVPLLLLFILMIVEGLLRSIEVLIILFCLSFESTFTITFILMFLGVVVPINFI